MDRTPLSLRESLALGAVLFAVGGVALLASALLPHLPPTAGVAGVSAARVVSLTNDERADEGVALLARNPLLDRAAQLKAEDMAAKGYYAHVSPEGLTPMHWAEQVGYRYLILGENLVVNRTDATQVVDAFMGSPGHRANILRKDFTEIGVGVADGTYKGRDATFTVQIFAAPYPTKVVYETQKNSKENLKKSSNAETRVEVPKKPVDTSVPRATAPAVPMILPARSPVSGATSTDSGASIQEKVKILIEPLQTFAPTTTSSLPVDIGRTVLLESVSQLASDAPPMPLGSTWSMQLRLMLESFVAQARTLLGN